MKLIRGRAFFQHVIAFLVFSCFTTPLLANHVKGGYIRYEYLGTGNTAGTSSYRVTITIFYGCGVQGPRSPITLNVLNAATGASVMSTSLTTTTSATVSKTSFNPCMSNPPAICYEIYTYVTTVTLTDNSSGYVLGVTDQYRTSGIINIASSSTTGIAFTAQIPAVMNSQDYHTNTSPAFDFKDTAIVCFNGGFTYQFSATDPVDHDSLTYSFGNGLNSSSSGTFPFYNALNYNAGYSGAAPMGGSVSINPVTGLISGSAPATTGEYVIAVYVTEWRNGVAIDAIKKELQVYVYNCSLAAASLDASYINCDNYTFTFSNQSTASNITAYNWDFGVLNITTDVSTQPTPTYVYPDTGTFTLKLKVSNAGGCQDSTTAPVRVYPGFFPGFTVSGSCYQSAFQFSDTTKTRYGTVSARHWDFGDLSTIADTSVLQNPTYLYPGAASPAVTLIVSSSKGCIDTVTKTVTVNDKPRIILPFSDTLICNGDRLPLIVQGSGTVFNWTPRYNITNPTTANPIVYPAYTTVYTVTVTENACIDSAKVTVNVLDFISVSLPADTAICATDTITLHPTSYALSYLWSESGSGNTLNNIHIKNPKAVPQQQTTYYVNANLGHCQAQAQTIVHTSPYPTVTVSDDTSICYGSSATLRGYTLAAHYAWSPAATLQTPGNLITIAAPRSSTTYALTVTDTFYCPKPVRDTVRVVVIDPVIVNAGNDTAIVYGQPLQLQANSSATPVTFQWTPASWLSNTTIFNPVANIGSGIDSIRYFVTATTAAGCVGSDAIKVTIYKTAPGFFIPTGFTPNGDGLNDVFKPVMAGLSVFSFFRVYNRWGQLVFETSQQGKGWDGKINGVDQNAGAYVVTAAGRDYTGKTVVSKGTVMLIR